MSTGLLPFGRSARSPINPRFAVDSARQYENSIHGVRSGFAVEAVWAHFHGQSSADILSRRAFACGGRSSFIARARSREKGSEPAFLDPALNNHARPTPSVTSATNCVPESTFRTGSFAALPVAWANN